MIRLQFVAERALSSAAIGWFSAGHLSHVDAILPDGSLLGARSDRVTRPNRQAIPAGVQVRPADYLVFSHRLVVAIPCLPGQDHHFAAFLAAQLGKPYDRMAIWGFALNRDWRAPDSWICSELQARALEAAGIFPRPLYLAANKMTPVALALALSAVIPFGPPQDG